MENNDYRRYIDRLSEVRSPMSADDVLRLLARSQRKRTVLPWLARFTSFVVLITLGGFQAESNPPTASAPSQIQRSSIVKPTNVIASEATTVLPDADQHKGNPDKRKQYTRAELPATASNEPPITLSIEPPAIAMPVLEELPADVAPQCSSPQLLELPTLTTKPLILTLSTDVQHLAATRVGIEYPIASHLAVGAFSGVTTRTSTSAVANVRFRDTTLESNGSTYTSTLGQLVPQSRTVAIGTVGVSVRLFLNAIESEWNVSVQLQEAYASSFTTSAEVGGRYQIATPYWLEAAAGTQDMLRASRYVSGRIGIAWQW